MSETSRVLRFMLVDDHAIMRAGVRGLLSGQFKFTAVEARNAQEALEAANGERFDLIVLDVTMPGRSGLDILTELKESQPTTPVLMLSMHAEEQFALRALRAGAAGYITKSQVPEELLKAVERLLAGGRYITIAMAERLAESFQGRGESRALGTTEALSAREFEVLRMIAMGKSGKEIAFDLSLSFKTVSTYRTRLLQKLSLQTNADLVKYATQHRLIESPDL